MYRSLLVIADSSGQPVLYDDYRWSVPRVSRCFVRRPMMNILNTTRLRDCLNYGERERKLSYHLSNSEM